MSKIGNIKNICTNHDVPEQRWNRRCISTMMRFACLYRVSGKKRPL